MSNRFDNRTPAEFAAYIKSSHSKELQIAIRLAIGIHHETGKWPTVQANGVDFKGDFIANSKDITSAPDFRIDGSLVEITRSDPVCAKAFHLKIHKLKKAISEKYDIVFVNGFVAKKQPDYVRLNYEQLDELMHKSMSKYGESWHPSAGGGAWVSKPAAKIELYWIKDLFCALPVLISVEQGLPKEYSDLLELVK